jgi:hypothetical protein
MKRTLIASCCLTATLAGVAAARAQVAGDNVNMVSGTEWPGGDPFLQRDNEPSMTVSSLNLDRLLAGANTYRTVDVAFPPGADTETGDAWLGLWKSVDAGRTWKTYLLPGYPQDTSPEGLASPLKQRGLTAAADPTVRAGTNGLFLLSGIAFNRQSDDGVVFVSRHIDLDIKENGDASEGRDGMPYVDTVVVDSGNAGQFLDKPWIAIDIPRPFAQGTCSISFPADHPVFPGVTRTFPVGPMYVTWSRFTGSQSTKIMVARSLDCGRTWSQPIKLSEGNSINQGTTLAIDPQTGAVYVAWRRFATSSQTDAILIARSEDGQTFGKAEEVSSFLPFDQGTTAHSFRTNALPTMAISVAGGASRLHVAWSQRSVAGGDARVVVSTSSDGGRSWGAPLPVDDGPATDQWGDHYLTDDGAALTRGHQVMPQMTFSEGKLLVVYYDLRLDHTTGVFAPNEPFEPDAEGRYYSETREKRGELANPPDDPDAVYTPYITDAPPSSDPPAPGLTIRRHTVDVRVAQANPGPVLAWSSVPLSRYRFGTRGDEVGSITDLKQLQVNPPNLPLFQQGTVPFFGDYIDIAGQAFSASSSSTGHPWCSGTWCYTVEPEGSPVHYATWTSNQDVRPPADGDWTHYTPVIYPPRPSLVDPSQTTASCVPGQEGMRNQNIYMSRITQGLAVSSPQSAKPLSPTLERAFVILVDNTTPSTRVYRLSIASQPPGGHASFLSADSTPDAAGLCAASAPGQGPTSCTALDVEIPARSSVARSVFVTSTDPAARLTVDAQELGAVGGSPVPGGLSGYVLLNATPVAALADPDGAGNIADGEMYDPTISLINVSNPNVSNINVSNPNVSNVNVSNINVSNPNVSNINVSNPDIADINVSNVNVSNPNVSNINVSNPNISNINVSNEPVTDASYAVTNTGNTTHSYHVQLVGDQPSTAPIQVILTKPYVTPTALNCERGVESHDATLASIVDPRVVPPWELGDPNIPDPDPTNATLSLAPGETAIVTIRAAASEAGLRSILTSLAPAIVAHGRNGHPVAAVLLVTTSSESLAPATVGVPYSLGLTSVGGTAPVTWSYSGQLPDGLALDSGTGEISGTPSAAGSFVASVTASDSASPPESATRTLTFTVLARATATTAVLSPATVPAGDTSLVTVGVSDVGSQGTPQSPSGTVSVAGSGVTGGNCTLLASGTAGSSCTVPVATALPGTYALHVAYEPASDPAVHEPSAVDATLLVVSRPTTTTAQFSPASIAVGQSSTATITVASAGSPWAPSGTVTYTGATDGSCVLAPSGPSAAACEVALAPSSPGSLVLDASYGGDLHHAASTGSATLAVGKAATTTALTSDDPDPSTVGQAVTTTVAVTTNASGLGAPTGTVTVSDGAGASCTISLPATSCSLTPGETGVRTWTATYSGDAVFAGSSGTASHEVKAAARYTFTGFLNPLTTAGLFPSASVSGSWNFSRVLPIKWRLADSDGKAVTSADAVSSLLALYSGPTCPGTPPALPNPGAVVLYDPVAGAAGGSDFRPGSTYNFNWDATRNAHPGCWWLVLQLADGSTPRATTIELK